MCIAHAWCASLFWHAATIRLNLSRTGIELFDESFEFWVVVAGASVAVGLFAISLALTLRDEQRAQVPTTPQTTIQTSGQ